MIAATKETSSEKPGGDQNRSPEEQNQNQLRQRNGDISREISPGEIGGRNEPTGEQRGKWEGLMREECQGVQRVFDWIGLRPWPEQQHDRICNEQDRGEDVPQARPPVFGQHFRPARGGGSPNQIQAEQQAEIAQE